jgi:AmmeMemoRadiSam system protein B
MTGVLIVHRQPAVAGTFYPGKAAAVAAEAARLVVGDAQPTPAIAVVSPHAGWMYSGALAGKLFAGVVVPERVLVIAPNHTGRGPRASLWSHGNGSDDTASRWQLPGLDVPIDAPFVASLRAEAPLLRADRDAHEDEHAIEVLLPLLAVRQPRLRLTAVVLGGLGFNECETLGAAIARAVAGADGPTLIVASSDMSHYLQDDEARAVDRLALAPLAAADPRGLYDTVRAHGISMCGYIPATVALVAARALGATRATLVGYATSADAGADRHRVVGYAAVRVDRE